MLWDGSAQGRNHRSGQDDALTVVRVQMEHEHRGRNDTPQKFDLVIVVRMGGHKQTVSVNGGVPVYVNRRGGDRVIEFVRMNVIERRLQET